MPIFLSNVPIFLNGCTAKVEAAKMKEHMETRVEEHLRMLAGYAKTLHTKVDALRTIVMYYSFL